MDSKNKHDFYIKLRENYEDILKPNKHSEGDEELDLSEIDAESRISEITDRIREIEGHYSSLDDFYDKLHNSFDFDFELQVDDDIDENHPLIYLLDTQGRVSVDGPIARIEYVKYDKNPKSHSK